MRHQAYCRVYLATQLRTDGVHYRESAGPGEAVLKGSSINGSFLLERKAMDQLLCVVFSLRHTER